MLFLEQREICFKNIRSAAATKQFLCQDFTELYTLLVKGVNIPCEPLEHYLVLEMGKQRSECLGVQIGTVDQAGRAFAVELLVRVAAVLPEGKGCYLCCKVCV